MVLAGTVLRVTCVASRNGPVSSIVMYMFTYDIMTS